MGAFIAVALGLFIVYAIKSINKKMGNGWGEAIGIGLLGWIMLGIAAVVVALLAYAFSLVWIPMLIIVGIVWFCWKSGKPKLHSVPIVRMNTEDFVGVPESRRIVYQKKIVNLTMMKQVELIVIVTGKTKDHKNQEVIARVSSFVPKTSKDSLGVVGTIVPDEDTMAAEYQRVYKGMDLENSVLKALNDVSSEYPKLLTYNQEADFLVDLITPMGK